MLLDKKFGHFNDMQLLHSLVKVEIIGQYYLQVKVILPLDSLSHLEL